MGGSLVMLVGLHVDDRQGWIKTKARDRKLEGRTGDRRHGARNRQRGWERWNRKWKGKINHRRVGMERELVGDWKSDMYCPL